MMQGRRPEWTWRSLWAAALIAAAALRGTPAAAQVIDPVVHSGDANADGSSAVADSQKQGQILDRVVAVVNGAVVLDSDVEEERRFEVFQPLRSASPDFSRTKAIERLINRALILQQMKLQNQAPITDEAVDTQLTQVRKDIPECKAYHCETDAGWKAFVTAQGFTMPELEERWRTRMEVLRFIEQRFRMGILISPDEIKTYYDKTLLQQQVSSLLRDWLTSLKAQGSVRILGAEEEATR